jgi:hypothetical protein
MTYRRQATYLYHAVNSINHDRGALGLDHQCSSLTSGRNGDRRRIV